MMKYALGIIAVFIVFLSSFTEAVGYYNCSSPNVVRVIEGKDFSKALDADVLECIVDNNRTDMLPYILEELRKPQRHPSMHIKILGELGGEREKVFLLKYWEKIEKEIGEIPEGESKYSNLFDTKVYLLDALYKLGNFSHLEELYTLASHPNKSVRFYSAGVLGKVGGKRAVTILRDMALNDPMRFPRYGAVSALMEMGDFEIFVKPDEFVAGGYITQEEADQIRRMREGESVE